MFRETKSKNKKYFCKSCLQCLSNINILTEHNKICLRIYGEQAVKLEGDFIEFENYLKQIPVPFKVCADFECVLKVLKAMKVFTQKTVKITFHAVFLKSLFVLIINLVNQLLFIEVEMVLIDLLKQF